MSRSGLARQKGIVERLRPLLSDLMKEGLSPGRAAAAVFVGCFIAMLPIYGFQSVAAIGLAVLLDLNKPLTLAATFLNNPLLQPFLIVASVQLGHLVLYGRLLDLRMSSLTEIGFQQQLGAWLVGSLGLGLLLGCTAASATYAFLTVRRRGTWLAAKVSTKSPDKGRERECVRFVRSLYADCRRQDRNFVKWKMRLDRIFPLLMREDLGKGPVVDLGCGYGIALALVGFRTPDRPLMGCDLDAHRIAAARAALAPLRAELTTADARAFEIPPAGLILIIDVLQYLSAEEQLALLEKCCASLLPEGKLIVRIPDDTPGRLTSRLSLAFDRLVFRVHRAETRPTVLSRAEYRRRLESDGMEIREQRFVNRIPLAHALFSAVKPGPPGV